MVGAGGGSDQVNLLITGYDENMKEIGDKTSSLMESYAHKHGMGFRRIQKFRPGYHPSWQKLFIVQQALQEGNNVLWLDADTIITNPEKAPWKNMKSKLHVSMDWGEDVFSEGHFSMGNFYACRESVMLFRIAILRGKEWGNEPLWEQSCLREIYETLPETRNQFSIHPRRVFNPVPIFAQMTAQEPWQEGDWLCHLTGICNEERLELFEKFKP